MPTMRKINGFTILAIIPEARTYFRTFGEEPDEGIFYTIVADDPSTDRTVVATVRNPMTDEQWIGGDYFHGELKERRTLAFVAAIKRSRLQDAVTQVILEDHLHDLHGI